MTPLLAALPILTAVIALALRVPAPRAAAAALAVAGTLAATAFPLTGAEALATATRSAPTLVEVLAVLLGGVALSDALGRAGAQARIAAWIERACAGDPARSTLLMVFGVIPFAESLTGFGMGAVVAVPLLLHLGFSATKAVTLGLLGLFLTTWGALAPGTIIAADLGRVDLHDLGVATALAALVGIVVAGVTALWVRGGALRAVDLFELALTGTALAGALVAANVLLGPALGGTLGGLAAVVVSLARFRLSEGVSLSLDAATRAALVPYAVVVGGVLVSTAIIRGFALSGGVEVLGRGSVWLFVGAVTVMVASRFDQEQLRATAASSFQRWRPVGLATGGFLIVGQLLTASGMSAALASGVARWGDGYLLAAPFVAGLGGFVTGSNAAANAMFAGAQGQVADALGTSRLNLVALQNFACGVATIAAPTRVALAEAVASAEGPSVDLGWVYRVLLSAVTVILAFLAAGAFLLR